VYRARTLCDHESLNDGLEFLTDTFRLNGYGDRQFRRAINRPKTAAQPPDKPTSVALRPLVNTTFNRIIRMLSTHIKSVGLPPRKIISFLRPMKDDLGLKSPGVYPANVVKFTLRRLAISLKSGSWSTTGTFFWGMPTNRL
jgi:hypothetical protein